MLRELMSFIREWLWPRLDDEIAPWLVDRDGRVYIPVRRVVLKAKS